MELAEAIRGLAKQQNEGEYPTAVLFGIVTKSSPIEIKVGERIFNGLFIVISEHLTKRRSNCSLTINGAVETGEIEIDNSLKVGDKVILVRQNGGQKYIVMDRIGG